MSSSAARSESPYFVRKVLDVSSSLPPRGKDAAGRWVAKRLHLADTSVKVDLGDLPILIARKRV
jgi:hypothetical protein